ncbi:hypothetical protein BH10ACT8_BH10ACT8_16330 [soil metagenome]
MNRILVGLSSLGLAAAILSAGGNADAAVRLPCSARMSNASPTQNSTINVLVSTCSTAFVPR